jgi:hypothetical protein
MTKQAFPLKRLIAAVSVFAFLAGPMAGTAFAEGAGSGQGAGGPQAGKGGPQGGGEKGGHGGASKTTEGKVTGSKGGGKAGSSKISGKDMARLNAARVFLSTGITKTDATGEAEAPLSKIYNYQQLLLSGDKDLNTVDEVAAAAINLAQVATIPVTTSTLSKLDSFLGTTFKNTFDWTANGGSVKSALDAFATSKLGTATDIGATPTSFTEAVNLLEKALKSTEE